MFNKTSRKLNGTRKINNKHILFTYMMAFRNALLKGLMIFYFATKFVNADECIVSKSTAMKVKSCPQTAEEWENAADKRGCESLNDSFIYHCVMNTWKNETIEELILTRLPRVQRRGCRIQRSKGYCSECPVSYNSSESYKYQECYPARVTKSVPSTTYSNDVTTDLKPTSFCNRKDKKNTTLYSVLFLLVLSFLCNLWCVIRKRNVFHPCKRNSHVKNVGPTITSVTLQIYNNTEENTHYEELGELAETFHSNALS